MHIILTLYSVPLCGRHINSYFCRTSNLYKEVSKGVSEVSGN